MKRLVLFVLFQLLMVYLLIQRTFPIVAASIKRVFRGEDFARLSELFTVLLYLIGWCVVYYGVRNRVFGSLVRELEKENG